MTKDQDCNTHEGLSYSVVSNIPTKYLWALGKWCQKPSLSFPSSDWTVLQTARCPLVLFWETTLWKTPSLLILPPKYLSKSDNFGTLVHVLLPSRPSLSRSAVVTSWPALLSTLHAATPQPFLCCWDESFILPIIISALIPTHCPVMLLICAAYITCGCIQEWACPLKGMPGDISMCYNWGTEAGTGIWQEQASGSAQYSIIYGTASRKETSQLKWLTTKDRNPAENQ